MKLADRKLAASKAIRELIKVKTGKTFIFNNIYKTGTRTVKIYRSNLSPEVVSILRDKITDLADMFNLDVKFRFTAGNRWGGPAFIVKL